MEEQGGSKERKIKRKSDKGWKKAREEEGGKKWTKQSRREERRGEHKE
jgi:hypothetical protein